MAVRQKHVLCQVPSRHLQLAQSCSGHSWPICSTSKRVDELRASITLDPFLLLSQAVIHLIPLSTSALGILDTEHDVHENATTKQEDDLVGKHNAVSGPEPWRLTSDVDIL